MMRKGRMLAVLAALVVLAGCAAIHRSSMAERAQTELVGMHKKDLLMCAGAPVRQQQVEDMEFLTYAGGGDSTTQTNTSGWGDTSRTNRKYCEATFALKDGVVQKVTYQGRTGQGLLASREQCGFIVENCVKN